MRQITHELCLTKDKDKDKDKDNNKSHKFFIFAESMRATIVFRALICAKEIFGYADRVDGIVFSGPVLRVAARLSYLLLQLS